MPVMKLTISEIQKTSPMDNRDVVFRDSDISGFSLKITPKGSKIFFFQYRIGGRSGISRKIRIGNFLSVKPNEARKIALGYAGEVARKIDPYERLKKETADKLNARKDTFGKLFEDYAVKQLSQNRSGPEVVRAFEREFLPKFRNRSIHSIERAEISKIIGVIAKRAPYSANRALSYIKTFFRWTVSEGYLKGDPTSVMRKPFKDELKRDRFLSPVENKLVWEQFEALESKVFKNALKVLLLTAQRCNEVSSMQWDDVDLVQGIWILPKSRTKNKTTHIVPLQGEVLNIVKKQPRLLVKNKDKRQPTLSPYVFTTTGYSPISGWSKIKKKIDCRLEKKKKVISNWRLHDLRRTVSTYLGDMGYSDHDIGMLLNHHSRGVTAIYNRSTYLEKKREMLQKWEAKLSSYVG